MFELVAGTVAQAVLSGAAEGVSTRPSRRGVDRVERLEAYGRFQQSVMRVQLRVDTLFSVHSAQYNPTHIAAWVSGYPLLIGLMNRLVDDFSEVTYQWQRVRLFGSHDAAQAAETLVLAVCDLLQHVDPGWHKPRARAQQRSELRAAKERLASASLAFDTAMRADAAPKRADRKTANKTLAAR